MKSIKIFDINYGIKESSCGGKVMNLYQCCLCYLFLLRVSLPKR